MLSQEACGRRADWCGTWQLSYIPVFASRASFNHHQQQASAVPNRDCRDGRVDDALHQCDRAVHSGRGVDDCSGRQQAGGPGPQTDPRCVEVCDAAIQQSLQLALDESSSDWQPQPLDTLVAVIGAPPAWLCGADSGSIGWGSSRALCSEAELVPTHPRKLCVTVSTVSSQLDSLAILPLRMPPHAKPAVSSNTGLACSRHLGEF